MSDGSEHESEPRKPRNPTTRSKKRQPPISDGNEHESEPRQPRKACQLPSPPVNKPLKGTKVLLLVAAEILRPRP